MFIFTFRYFIGLAIIAGSPRLIFVFIVARMTLEMTIGIIYTNASPTATISRYSGIILYDYDFRVMEVA